MGLGSRLPPRLGRWEVGRESGSRGGKRRSGPGRVASWIGNLGQGRVESGPDSRARTGSGQVGNCPGRAGSGRGLGLRGHMQHLGLKWFDICHCRTSNKETSLSHKLNLEQIVLSFF